MSAPKLAAGFLLLALAAHADPPRRVSILPLGKVEQRYLDAVSTAIRARLDVEVRIEPARELPEEAYYPPRKRWRAEKILDAIDAHPPEGAWKVLALTHAEISTTKGEVRDWGIGGLGSIDGRSCVVSTHLIRKHSKTAEKALIRLADLAVHELGHTLGLDHCPTEGCVMADAQGKLIRSLDASKGHYCEQCRAKLSPALLKAPK